LLPTPATASVPARKLDEQDPRQEALCMNAAEYR
jgi:hypothetical protein